MSQGSSVSTVTRIQNEHLRYNKKIFCRHVQTSYEAQPTSCQMGTGGSFLGGKVVSVWSWKLIST